MFESHNLPRLFFRLKDGAEEPCLISVNRSRICPRLEVGVCKYVDIAGLKREFAKRGVSKGFGADKYWVKPDRNEDPERNLWIWLAHGAPKYISFPMPPSGSTLKQYHYRSSRGNNPRDWTYQERLEASLLVKCGNVGIGMKNYHRIPFVADEWTDTVSIGHQFSAPARYLLEKF